MDNWENRNREQDTRIDDFIRWGAPAEDTEPLDEATELLAWFASEILANSSYVEPEPGCGVDHRFEAHDPVYPPKRAFKDEPRVEIAA